MKLKTKIKLIIFIFIISLITSFFLFIIFINDPFIKYAPENTKIYSLININQKIKDEDANKIFSLKNISINKILENKEFKKIKSDYIGKISFFITDDNNFYIILKEKLFKKNIYNIDCKNLSSEINKYTNLDIDLRSYKLGRYVVLTNNNIEYLKLNNYKFFINNYKKLILQKEFSFLLKQDLFKIYIDSLYLNNFIRNTTESHQKNYFTKDYSLAKIKLSNKEFNISISNLENEDSVLNSYSINYLKNNYLIINNFNISKTISTFINNYKNKSIKSNENLNYLSKNILEDGFNLDSMNKIFSNNSSLFLNFKDSNINLNNIDSFLLLTKLDNFNDYIDNISNLEKVFLMKSSLNKPSLENIVLTDGTIAKEQIINYSNTFFKIKEVSKNNINYTIKYLDYNNHKLYYSMINEDGLLLISDNEDMLTSIYKKSTRHSFTLNNFNVNILANIKQDILNIVIK